MLSYNNKFLIVKEGVILTKHIDPVIFALDKYFADANLKAYVTSGLRDAHRQLRVIRQYLTQKKLDSLYPDAMTCQPADIKPGTNEYVWQRAWSHLLSTGLVINPPLRAICLVDYLRRGVNMKGQYINQTPHAKGTAFDIGGGANTVSDESIVLKAAFGKVKGLKNYLVERENNAIHVDCEPVI